MFLCVWAKDTLKHRVGPLCVHGIFLGDKGIHTASLAVCFPHSTQPLFLFLHNKQVRLLLPCCVKDRTPMFTFTRFCTLQNCSFVPFCVGLLSSQTELHTKDAKEMLPMFLTGSSFRITSPTTALQTHCLCGCSSLSGTDLCTEDVEHSLFSGRRLHTHSTTHLRFASLLCRNRNAGGTCPCPFGRGASLVPLKFCSSCANCCIFSPFHLHPFVVGSVICVSFPCPQAQFPQCLSQAPRFPLGQRVSYSFL